MVRPVNTNTGANSDLAKDRNEDPITGSLAHTQLVPVWVRLLVALQLGRWPVRLAGQSARLWVLWLAESQVGWVGRQ